MEDVEISNKAAKAKHYKILGLQAVWVFSVPIAWIIRFLTNPSSWDLFTGFWITLSVIWFIGCVLIWKYVK